MVRSAGNNTDPTEETIMIITLICLAIVTGVMLNEAFA